MLNRAKSNFCETKPNTGLGSAFQKTESDQVSCLQSLDLEYHNLDSRRGLYFALGDEGRQQRVISPERMAFSASNPPSNTRAQARGIAVRYLRDQTSNYIINWDSIAVENKDPLIMGNPFHPYRTEVAQLLSDDRVERESVQLR